MTRENEDDFEFSGLGEVTQSWFKMPNEWTDITSQINSLAELKVVEYIIRHTWGFSEYEKPKHLTTDDFQHGRKRIDGSRMDKGTGLSDSSIRSGLQLAVKHRLIFEEVDTSDRGRIRKSYWINMGSGETPQDLMPDQRNPLVDQQYPLVPQQSPLIKAAKSAGRSEKDTLERHFQKHTPSPRDRQAINQGSLPVIELETKERESISPLLHTHTPSQGSVALKVPPDAAPESAIPFVREMINKLRVIFPHVQDEAKWRPQSFETIVVRYATIDQAASLQNILDHADRNENWAKQWKDPARTVGNWFRRDEVREREAQAKAAPKVIQPAKRELVPTPTGVEPWDEMKAQIANMGETRPAKIWGMIDEISVRLEDHTIVALSDVADPRRKDTIADLVQRYVRNNLPWGYDVRFELPAAKRVKTNSA